MNGYTIIKEHTEALYPGCDVVVRLEEGRAHTGIKLLQLTDMQVIDAAQRRTPDRIRADEIEAWDPKRFDAQCGDHIRSLVAQTRPDLIFITGDIIYGSFDDAGTTFEWFCRLMDSFEIPWAPVFGNHDNESRRGVDWQCTQFETSKYCLFKRGNVTGNGNYTVGIAVGERLMRVLHMIDSNGCSAGEDPSIVKKKGIYPDQLELISAHTEEIRGAQGRSVPAFMAFHIPVDCYVTAEESKGYTRDGRSTYCIGVDVPAAEGDFGFRLERFSMIPIGPAFVDFLHANAIDGVFAGHMHNACTCIGYQGIKWVFGLKTGQYDYHIPGQVGGTLVTLEDECFSVAHLPALVPSAPMPEKAPMFQGFFATGEAVDA